VEDEAAQDPGPETVSLGQFDVLELPIILETLRDRGIFALTKTPLGEADHQQYAMLLEQSGRRTLLVDRDRKDEARRIIDTEVKAQVAEMRATLDTAGDVDFEAEGLIPIGWLEPEVARELLTALRNADIRAEPEYPLDGPPPPYARADGRVRVHVEELLFDDAVDILWDEVFNALVARGFTPKEPLLGEDE
jgi:hypothetical protein